MKFSKLNLPFDIVTEGANLILLEVAPYYLYVDGKKTDKLEGYRYTVVEDSTFEKFSIKVPSSVPAITQEMIDASSKRIMVDFENAIAKPYKNHYGDYDLSISAVSIVILE